jgi:hypothetical protein
MQFLSGNLEVFFGTGGSDRSIIIPRTGETSESYESIRRQGSS